MKRYLAEAIGTFSLVFAGTAAIVVNQASGGAVTHAGVSLVFGLVVLAMIHAVGDVSGAHLNPAVTFGFWRAGRFPGREVLPYGLSQLAGALAASLCVRVLFPAAETLGNTAPSGPARQSFFLEFLLTFLLMWTILNVCSGAKEKGVTAGIAIGSVVALEALLGGPVSGASMNPARSAGPALVTLRFDALWIYMLAPIAGAWAAVAGCRCVRGAECCS